MYGFYGNNLNSLAHSAAFNLWGKGNYRKSDKGEVLELKRAISELHNPLSRYLNIIGRNNNVFASIAETFWILAGRSNVDGWLESFIPRATLYTNENSHDWYIAYGKQIYRDGQLASVITRLKESVHTRQAVLSIFDSTKETVQSLINNLGTTESKDLSCNNILYFSTDNTGKRLDLHICNRSNDIIYGAYAINVFEFTVLQELVAAVVGLDLGVYSVYHNNLHVYCADEQATKLGNDKAWKQFIAMVEAEDINDDFEHNLPRIGKISTDLTPDQFCLKLRNTFNTLIRELEDEKQTIDVIASITRVKLQEIGILEPEESSLYFYTLLLKIYIDQKAKKLDKSTKEYSKVVDVIKKSDTNLQNLFSTRYSDIFDSL